MTRRFGADTSIYQDLSLPIVDSGGRIVLGTDDSYGGSPMGISLREQVLFGLPNATFNLLPPDPSSQIDETDNPLPFWSIQTTPNMYASATFDTTTKTWGIKIDPGTAPSGDYLTLKTRAWVTTDDNLALRQKASLTLAKTGTYAGTSQWNAVLSCEYFDHANLSLGSFAIGTVFDNTTWTSISGTTTAGGSAISANASWAEFTVKVTTTATVSSSTSLTLQSLLVASSTPAAGGAFVVSQAFTSSGTWTAPTGVTSVNVFAVGGGGGGGGGYIEVTSALSTTSNSGAAGSGGGGGGAALYVLNVPITSGSAYSIGIGTAGSGGTAITANISTTTTDVQTGGSLGGNGGATTFGALVSATGGTGGAGGSASSVGAGGAGASVSPPGMASFYPTSANGGGGGTTGSGTAGAGTAGLSLGGYSWTIYPNVSTLPAAGSAGSTGSGGTAIFAFGTVGSGGSAGFGGSGGGSGGVRASRTTAFVATSGNGGFGGGGGGGASFAQGSVSTTASPSTAGAGGAGAPNSGGGGGAGGALFLRSFSLAAGHNTGTMSSGPGGNGGSGYCVVIWTA